MPKPNILNGTAGDDQLNGGPGPDNINGRGGNDTLLGQAGDDHILGGTGNDKLIGGAGDDFIVGGGEGGNDTIDGGTGEADYAVFYFDPRNVGSYVLVEGNGADTGKWFVDLTNEFVTTRVAEITVAGDVITVTGVGVSNYLGVDTVTNVDGLIFSNVSSDPFTIPVVAGYLVVDPDSLLGV
jgi:Ca2+-binding RTX toxin-like protein